MALMHKVLPPRLRRKLVRLLFVLVLAVALTFAALELVCRILDPGGISYYPETAAYLDTMVLEEPIGYRNRPGLNGTFYRVPVNINSLGLRDREVPPDPADNEYRVLLLGDSVAFGIGVPCESTISCILEKLLNKAAGRELQLTFRVLNMGVISYNTEQELIQLRTLGLRLHPRLVLLVYSTNDVEPKTWVHAKRRRTLVNLAQRSYALSAVFHLARSIRYMLLGAGRTPYADKYRPDYPGWMAVDKSLTEINRTCRSAGIPFVVFTAPIRFTVPGPENPLVGSVGLREAFPVVYLDPWHDARWRNEPPKKYVVPHGLNHPNTAGNEIYATLICERLLRMNVLPRRNDTRPADQAKESVPPDR